MPPMNEVVRDVERAAADLRDPAMVAKIRYAMREMAHAGRLRGTARFAEMKHLAKRADALGVTLHEEWPARLGKTSFLTRRDVERAWALRRNEVVLARTRRALLDYIDDGVYSGTMGAKEIDRLAQSINAMNLMPPIEQAPVVASRTVVAAPVCGFRPRLTTDNAPSTKRRKRGQR